MTLVLGLTGSIGMGKSTTAGFFRDAGVPVWDADAAVHALYRKGGPAVAPLAALHPAAIVDGAIDRAALRDWIAADKTALKQIEAVVHPLVGQSRADFIAENADKPLVVVDVPLLFETGGERGVDAVLVVSAPPEVQRERVLARPDMTEAHFQTILSKQMPDAEKRARADHIIETLTLDQTRSAVFELVAKLSGESRNA